MVKLIADVLKGLIPRIPLILLNRVLIVNGPTVVKPYPLFRVPSYPTFQNRGPRLRIGGKVAPEVAGIREYYRFAYANPIRIVRFPDYTHRD